MGAGNEPIIYAGALIVALMMFSIGMTASEKVLTSAFNKMDYQHARYESVHRAYLFSSDGYNYNSTLSEADAKINTVSGNCRFSEKPEKFLYANRTELMNISVYGFSALSDRFSDCQGLLYDWRYPIVAFNVNGDGGDPGKSDALNVYPDIN